MIMHCNYLSIFDSEQIYYSVVLILISFIRLFAHFNWFLFVIMPFQ